MPKRQKVKKAVVAATAVTNVFPCPDPTCGVGFSTLQGVTDHIWEAHGTRASFTSSTQDGPTLDDPKLSLTAVVELLTETRHMYPLIGAMLPLRNLVAFQRTSKVLCASLPRRGQFSLNALVQQYVDAATADRHYGMAAVVAVKARKLASWKAVSEEKKDDDDDDDAVAAVDAQTQCWLPRSFTAESEVEVTVRESRDAIAAAIVRYEAYAPICNPSVELERMMCDINRAYHLLQTSSFATMSTNEMRLIIAVVEEIEWPVAEDKQRLKATVVVLLSEFVALSDDLKRLANATIVNDMTHEMERPISLDQGNRSEWEVHESFRGRLRYDKTTATEHDSYNWGRLESTTQLNWTEIFKPSDEDEDSGYCKTYPITPRMAFRLHYAISGYLTDWGESAEKWNSSEVSSNFKLPIFARAFWRKSEEWRHNYRGCFLRIACRLQLGLNPKPNCVGEMQALNEIMGHAQDCVSEYIADGEGEHAEYFELPEHKNDEQWSELDTFVQDEDYEELFYGLLMFTPPLFRPGDEGRGDDDDQAADGELDYPEGFAHPAEWFTAFEKERFVEHINPLGRYSEGCSLAACPTCGDSFIVRDFRACPDIWGPRPSRNSAARIWRPLVLSQLTSIEEMFMSRFGTQWPASFLGLPHCD